MHTLSYFGRVSVLIVADVSGERAAANGTLVNLLQTHAADAEMAAGQQDDREIALEADDALARGILGQIPTKDFLNRVATYESEWMFKAKETCPDWLHALPAESTRWQS